MQEPKAIQVSDTSDKRQQFQKMLEMNEEIDKFKQNLLSIRPKSSSFDIKETYEANKRVEVIKMFNSKQENFENNVDERVDGFLSVTEMTRNGRYYSHSTDSGVDTPSRTITFESPLQEVEHKPEPLWNGESNNQVAEEMWNGRLNDSDSESCAASMIETIDSDDGKCSSIVLTPKYCPATQLKLTLQPKKNIQHERLELVITPTFKFNVQEAPPPNQNSVNSTDCNNKRPIVGIENGSIDQQLSILIQKINITGYSNESKQTINNDKGDEHQSIERKNIIDELFSTDTKTDFIILQKYFLRWVHFTTIEKLMHRSPEQSRLQKMQAFLQNITVHRKKALNKLRQTNAIDSSRDEHRLDVKMQSKFHPESPRLMLRKYNNK